MPAIAFKASIKYGLLAGFISIAYMLLFYFIDKKMMMGAWVYWSSVAIFCTAMIMAVLAHRRMQVYQLIFFKAVKTVFIVYLIADIIWYIFYYLLFEFIDPGLEEVTRQITIDALMAYKDAGQTYMGDQNISTLIQQARETDYGLSIALLLPKLAYGLIGGFILSLIFGTAFKSE